jgi:hypothetical protein
MLDGIWQKSGGARATLQRVVRKIEARTEPYDFAGTPIAMA